MFEFSEYNQELNNFCIPDITNIIIGYVTGYIEKFDEDFIENCINNGQYLYYNKNKVTLIHYLFEKYLCDHVKILLKNSKYLRAKYFQNKNNIGETELHWLCFYEMHNIIIQIDGLKTEHFQNKNDMGETELYLLCKNEMHNTIIQIDGLKAKHFQNKDKYGQTELYWLCYHKMHDTIIQISRNFADSFWKFEHCSTDMERQYMTEHILI